MSHLPSGHSCRRATQGDTLHVCCRKTSITTKFFGSSFPSFPAAQPAQQGHSRAAERSTSRPPRMRAPLGEFLLPLTRCQMPPPTAPMPNAPPMSPRILYGQGSRPWSTPARHAQPSSEEPPHDLNLSHILRASSSTGEHACMRQQLLLFLAAHMRLVSKHGDPNVAAPRQMLCMFCAGCNAAGSTVNWCSRRASRAGTWTAGALLACRRHVGSGQIYSSAAPAVTSGFACRYTPCRANRIVIHSGSSQVTELWITLGQSSAASAPGADPDVHVWYVICK